jgi:[acyl-carrier-protein] S-malonyltransferase
MLELSPGGTLSGIAKKGAPGIETCALKTPADLDIAKEFIRKHIGY